MLTEEHNSMREYLVAIFVKVMYNNTSANFGMGKR